MHTKVMRKRKLPFTDEEAEDFRRKLMRFKTEIHKEIIGLEHLIDAVIITLLAGVETRFHLLINAEPGTGKTKLINTIDHVVGLQLKRQQFTPDIEPKDLYMGFAMLEEGELSSEKLTIRKGSLFTEILLADELNRTPEKTQSALLEAAEEKQITFEGKTYPTSPSNLFYLMGTINPIEAETSGVYPLSTALMDRISFLCTLDFPSVEESERIIVRDQRPKELEEVLQKDEIQKWGKHIYAHYALRVREGTAVSNYIARILAAARAFPARSYGPSIRFAEDLKVAAAIYAFLEGKDKITQNNIKKVAMPALRGRIGLNMHALQELYGWDDMILGNPLEVREPAIRDIINSVPFIS